MKTAQLPPVRVEPAVRPEIENALHKGESLSGLLKRRHSRWPVVARPSRSSWPVAAIRSERRVLESNLCNCRKVSSHPLERELIIPFGTSGYVVLFEIISDAEVVVSTLRPQREDDCH
jgi:hypothetical protein